MKKKNRYIIYSILVFYTIGLWGLYGKEKFRADYLEEQINHALEHEQSFKMIDKEKELKVNQVKILPQKIDPKRLDGLTLVKNFEIRSNVKSTGQYVELFVDAARTEEGNFSFDDNQNWLLLVRDNMKEYVLFDEKIQLGKLEAHIYDVYEEDKTETHILTILSATAGLIIKEYTIDSDKEVVTEKLISDNSGINYLTDLDY